MPEKIQKIENYNVFTLNKETAIINVKKITQLADSIPLVNYSEEHILAESKPGRIFLGKWEHSLIVFDDANPIAIIIGYERIKENNLEYPYNSIYISELAVDKKYQNQGIAKKLIKLFLENNKKFLYLDGNLLYSVQTNSAEWNSHVINLYKSLGFKQTSLKKYDNRIDVVLNLDPIKK